MTNIALAGLITPLFSVALAKKTERGAVRAPNKGPAQHVNASRCGPNKLCFLGSGSGDDLPVTVATPAVNMKRPSTHPSPSRPLHPDVRQSCIPLCCFFAPYCKGCEKFVNFEWIFLYKP